MKDRNVKQVMLKGEHQWEGEGKRREQRRVNMIDAFSIQV
jgi:hypothetical protein